MGKQLNLKAVIWYMASRPCLKKNLELLYQNFNNEYQYPVLITSFGPKYRPGFIKKIHQRIDPRIKFMELAEPKIPSRIKEEELFYNRKEIDYVRKFFPKSRAGYLHMINFVAGGVMKIPEINQYDYVLKMDDDTFFIKKPGFDIFQFMRNNNYQLASSDLKKYDKERQRNCQIGLRELVKKYIKDNNIVPVNNLALDGEGNWNSVCAYDPSLLNLNIFRNKNWEKWWHCVDQSGGIYKYRWGDLEIHSLYLAMYYPASAWHNFDFYQKGIVKHGGYGMVHQGIQGKFSRLLKALKNINKKKQ